MPNTEPGPITLGSDTVAALESAWADIADRNPDVIRDVFFRVGSGRAGRRGGLVLGSVEVAANWQQHRPTTSRAKSDPDRYHCVFIAGETLAQEPTLLLETLIHEAAHTVAMTRGVKDTSRQYRYHNRRFRAIAEEMGLEWSHLQYRTERDADGVAHTIPNPDFDEAEPADLRTNPRYLTEEASADEVIGFSDMKITKATTKAYRDTLTNLDRNVEVQLNAEAVKNRPPKRRRTVVMVPHPEGPGLVTADEAHDFLGDETETETEYDPQRLGVVVYEGLVSRQLLAAHVAYIEEV